MERGRSVAVIGATGAVGAEILALLEERRFPVAELRALASARSAGREVAFAGGSATVREATPESLAGVEVAFFSAGAARSRTLVPGVLAGGGVAVDNSSAFRMQTGVPLVVPEINGETLGEARLLPVANCTAILLCMVLHPLRRLGSLARVSVATYQSASGGGAGLMRRLRDETVRFLAGDEGAGERPYAFNLYSHDSPLDENGENEEERKVGEETRRILDLPGLRIAATCVRVPVLRAHTEVVGVEFEAEAPSVEAVREAFAAAPGVRLLDDREANRFPTPREASGGDDVLVGRIRRDPSRENGLLLMLAGDQLRKGAALNAVQLAELALARG